MSSRTTAAPEHRESMESAGAAARAVDAAGVLRRILLIVLIVGIVGTSAELVLLEHYETVWQWTPLAIFGAGLLAGLATLIRPGRRVLRVFQFVMLLFIVAGGLGLYLHYKGNAEFELEMVPALRGLELFWESIRGATPALAPGTMVQMGLLGLVITFRHPLLRTGSRGASPGGS